MTPVNAEMRFYAIDGHDAIDTFAIILHIAVIIERIGHVLIAKQAVVFIGNGLYTWKDLCIFDIHPG